MRKLDIPKVLGIIETKIGIGQVIKAEEKKRNRSEEDREKVYEESDNIIYYKNGR